MCVGCLQTRAVIKREKAKKFGAKVEAKAQRTRHKLENRFARNEFAHVFDEVKPKA